jgi:hypothetical protein
MKLRSIFASLEARAEECAVLVAEPTGTTETEREAMAAALIAVGTPMLWFVAAPLLALFYSERETVVLVMLEATRACILPVYLGHAVVDASTEVSTNGSSGSVPAILDAILATVDAADVSLRTELLANVVLVGEGAQDSAVGTSLRSGLQSVRLANNPRWHKRYWRADGAPAETTVPAWRESAAVVANADRTLGTWLGAANVGSLSSAAAHFVPRAKARHDPSLLHANAWPIACRTIDEQREYVLAAAQADAAARVAERRASGEAATESAEAARAWWVEQAAAAVRSRPRVALRRHLLQAAEWWTWQRAVRQCPPRPPMGLFVPTARTRFELRYPAPPRPPPEAFEAADTKRAMRSARSDESTTRTVGPPHVCALLAKCSLMPARWPWEAEAAESGLRQVS